MYRKALAIRKAEAGLGDGPMTWLEVNDEVLAFTRPGNFTCYVNFGAEIDLPAGAEILVSSVFLVTLAIRVINIILA